MAGKSTSIDEVRKDPGLYKVVVEYFKKSFAMENIDFYFDCSEAILAGKDTATEELYRKYIGSEVVNLPGEMFNKMKALAAAGSWKGIGAELPAAKAQIFTLIQNMLSDFYGTDKYKEYEKSIGGPPKAVAAPPSGPPMGAPKAAVGPPTGAPKLAVAAPPGAPRVVTTPPMAAAKAVGPPPGAPKPAPGSVSAAAQAVGAEPRAAKVEQQETKPGLERVLTPEPELRKVDAVKAAKLLGIKDVAKLKKAMEASVAGDDAAALKLFGDLAKLEKLDLKPLEIVKALEKAKLI